MAAARSAGRSGGDASTAKEVRAGSLNLSGGGSDEGNREPEDLTTGQRKVLACWGPRVPLCPRHTTHHLLGPDLKLQIINGAIRSLP